MQSFIKAEDLTDSDWLSMAVSSPFLYTYLIENVTLTYKLYCLISNEHYDVGPDAIHFIVNAVEYFPVLDNKGTFAFVYSLPSGIYSRVLEPSQLAFTRS